MTWKNTIMLSPADLDTTAWVLCKDSMVGIVGMYIMTRINENFGFQLGVYIFTELFFSSLPLVCNRIANYDCMFGHLGRAQAA